MAINIVDESFIPVPVFVKTVTQFATPAPEGGSATYAMEFDGLDNTDLDAVELTFFDEETFQIINGRSGQDVLGEDKTGQSNVTVGMDAKITWFLQSADNKVWDRTKRLEYHRAIFSIVVDAETLIHEVRFPVRRVFSPLRD